MAEPAVLAASIAALCSIIGTTFTIICGFRSNKRLEQVKSQLTLQGHVQRVKFEKEFQVLQEVWNRLIDLHNAGAAFAPGFKTGKRDELEDRKLFVHRYYDFMRAIDVQKPFFPQEIFDILENYRKIQIKYYKSHEFITQSGFRPDWVADEFWDRRDEQLQGIEKLAEEVCAAIRQRSQ